MRANRVVQLLSNEAVRGALSLPEGNARKGVHQAGQRGPQKADVDSASTPKEYRIRTNDLISDMMRYQI